MDKFFSISKAAYELGIHEDDLFDLASDGVVTLTWQPSGFDRKGVDIVQLELTTVTGLDGEKYEGWKRVKDSKIIKHEFGPFQIDTLIDDHWLLIFDGIKNKFNVDNHFGFDDNLRFKYSDCIYRAYFNNPLTVYLPRGSEFNIQSSELDRYKKQLKRDNDLPKIKFTKQRVDVIGAFMKANAKELSNIPENKGKGGLRGMVWEGVKLKKINGKYLFSKRGEGDYSIESFNTLWTSIHKEMRMKYLQGG